jgi:hypothetical protein
MVIRVVKAVAIAMVIAAVVQSLPDIQRYLKIREM